MTIATYRRNRLTSLFAVCVEYAKGWERRDMLTEMIVGDLELWGVAGEPVFRQERDELVEAVRSALFIGAEYHRRRNQMGRDVPHPSPSLMAAKAMWNRLSLPENEFDLLPAP